jgi:hypothetical protein
MEENQRDLMLIFLASRTHAHQVCVYMCQYNVCVWSPVCMQCLGFAAKDRCVLLRYFSCMVVGGTAVTVTLSDYIAVVVTVL